MADHGVELLIAFATELGVKAAAELGHHMLHHAAVKTGAAVRSAAAAVHNRFAAVEADIEAVAEAAEAEFEVIFHGLEFWHWQTFE
jgi:hypothetical protein